MSYGRNYYGRKNGRIYQMHENPNKQGQIRAFLYDLFCFVVMCGCVVSFSLLLFCIHVAIHG